MSCGMSRGFGMSTTAPATLRGKAMATVRPNT